jgi:phosphoglycolate phosphatase-like HAD superfamily hydrolase
VGAAFRAYAVYAQDHGWKTDRQDGLPPWFGPGLSKEIQEGLAHADVKKRHAALQSLVEKYVTRRFDNLRMSDERRIRMKESLKEGMGLGLKRLKESGGEAMFPSSCPSCEGAN